MIKVSILSFSSSECNENAKQKCFCVLVMTVF